MSLRKQIAVYYTGGTIGMSAGEHGLQPAADLPQRAAALLAERGADTGLALHWHSAEPLIDSSALHPTHWQQWLNWLRPALAAYDGVLLLHGTDTLAYSANLLAMLLADTGKPVVITGAQWPLGQEGSDAPLNLCTATAAFGLQGLHGVTIAFNGALWRAVGSSKVSTETAAGFASPHFPPLGLWSDTTGWQQTRLHTLPPPTATAPSFDPAVRIVCHTFTPGANSAMIAASLQQYPADGVVLESYGHGNAPADDALLSALRQLQQRGIPVLNISQVAQGCAAAVYAQGHALRQCGVINGGRANRETAVALMSLAVANRWSSAAIEQQLHYWQLL